MKILVKGDGKTGDKHKSETIRVLLIESSQSFIRQIREMLAKTETISSVNSRYELVHADRLSTGLKHLTEGGINLVLLDLSLPDSEGLATLNRVYIRAPEVPIVVLTTLYDEELAVATLREGACDYLVKRQVDSNLLVRSMRYAIKWHRMLAELQQKNQALTASKAYTESIIQKFLDILIVVDKGTKIQTVNPATTHLLGYREEELIGQPVSIIFAEEEEEEEEEVRRVFQFFQELEKAETLHSQDTIRNYQLTCKTKNGRLIPMLFNASVLTDEAGNITGVVAEAKDITEIKQTEEALKKSQADFRRMIEKNADGIIIVDRNGVVRFVNPAGEALFSRKAEKLLNESFGFPVVTDETTELEIIHRNNKTAAVEMRVVQIEWEGDVAYLASLRDITERKKIEQTKDEFISSVSHELKTPLAIIKEVISLVIDEIPGKIVEAQKDVLVMAEANTLRLSKIIDSLLDISRLEAGKVQLDTHVVEITEIIVETVSDFKHKAEQDGISLGYEIPSVKLNISCDSDRIRQVLVNFLSNALKFTPRGGGVKVVCKEEENEVIVFVEDTGIGISEVNIPKLFNRFVQIDREFGAGEKGTGLGLAISKELVELHKGRIWAESKVNSGSRFYFSLPKSSSKKKDVAGKIF